MGKNFWESKSIWAQLVTLVVTMAGVFGLNLDISPESQAALVGGIHAAVGIVMRFYTYKAIS